MRCIAETVLVLTLHGMHTRARKEYVIEHSTVVCVCNDGVQRYVRERERKERREKERAKKEKRVGKRKHSMPVKKDKKDESKVTLVLFFVPQSSIEPAS